MSTNAEESYYNDKYDAIVANEFTYLETSQTKLTASIVHACCGSLSSLSSVLVLSIIYRSKIGLSSTHHRFLFAIGICDFISSFAIGLSTLPMPKDMIYTQFEGNSFGNFITSDIQGFCAHYFSGLMISFHCGLCFYYLCIIPFQMSKKKFGTRVEPFIHIGVRCFHLPIDLSLVLTKVSRHFLLYLIDESKIKASMLTLVLFLCFAFFAVIQPITLCKLGHSSSISVLLFWREIVYVTRLNEYSCNRSEYIGYFSIKFGIIGYSFNGDNCDVPRLL